MHLPPNNREIGEQAQKINAANPALIPHPSRSLLQEE
jgi:hypothetical protein